MGTKLPKRTMMYQTKEYKGNPCIPQKNINPIIVKKLNIAKSDIEKVFGEK
ncbi:MAG: hypothetical protein ACRCZH_02610 [Cetobacterium sp.]